MTTKTQKLLEATTILVAPQSHIAIKDEQVCQQKCVKKYCTKFCPTNVFVWSSQKGKILINYEQCIECLACPFGCPYQNINWDLPPSGYGVQY
ncbi:MAG: ferredoxin family protein [Bacillota bacterium]